MVRHGLFSFSHLQRATVRPTLGHFLRATGPASRGLRPYSKTTGRPRGGLRLRLLSPNDRPLLFPPQRTATSRLILTHSLPFHVLRRRCPLEPAVVFHARWPPRQEGQKGKRGGGKGRKGRSASLRSYRARRRTEPPSPPKSACGIHAAARRIHAARASGPDTSAGPPAVVPAPASLPPGGGPPGPPGARLGLLPRLAPPPRRIPAAAACLAGLPARLSLIIARRSPARASSAPSGLPPNTHPSGRRPRCAPPPLQGDPPPLQGGMPGFARPRLPPTPHAAPVPTSPLTM